MFLETNYLLYDPKLLAAAYSGAFLGVALTKLLGPPLKKAIDEAFDFLLRVRTCVFNIARRVIYSLGGCFGPAAGHVRVSRVTIS